MKRIMSIAAIALFMAGSSVFACDSCGCKAKKAEKPACTACKDGKKCEACAKKAKKKCPAGCTKACCKK